MHHSKIDDFISRGLMHYRKPRRYEEHRSWTKFDDRPVVRRDLQVEHIHVYRVAQAQAMPAITKCEAGKPLVAMKWWQADYRNGGKGWN